MSKLTKHKNSRKNLKSFLVHPQLLTRVQELPSQTLNEIIQSIGLADSQELLVLATSDQLRDILDLNLWQPNKKGLEVFNHMEFLEWLDVLLEADRKILGIKLQELGADFLCARLTSLIMVFDIEEIALNILGQDQTALDELDRTLDSFPQGDFGEYLLICKDERHWPIIEALFSYLYSDLHSYCTEVLTRFKEKSSDLCEEEGVDHVVSLLEQALDDELEKWEERRTKHGFVLPKDAQRLVEIWSAQTIQEILDYPKHGVITKIYIDNVRKDLQLIEKMDSAFDQRIKPIAKDALEEELEVLRALDEDLYEERKLELVFLCNMLIAQDTNLSPLETVEDVRKACKSGLKKIRRERPMISPIFGSITCLQVFAIGKYKT